MDNVNGLIAAAPVPSESEIRRRSNLLVQLGRFVVLNLRIMRMVAKGHR